MTSSTNVNQLKQSSLGFLSASVLSTAAAAAAAVVWDSRLQLVFHQKAVWSCSLLLLVCLQKLKLWAAECPGPAFQHSGSYEHAQAHSAPLLSLRTIRVCKAAAPSAFFGFSSARIRPNPSLPLRASQFLFSCVFIVVYQHFTVTHFEYNPQRHLLKLPLINRQPRWEVRWAVAHVFECTGEMSHADRTNLTLEVSWWTSYTN